MGWNGSNNTEQGAIPVSLKRQDARHKAFHYRLAVWMLIVVLALLAIPLVFKTEEKHAIARPAEKKIAQIDNHAKPSPSNQVAKVQPAETPTQTKSETYLGTEVKYRTFTTNNNGFVIERIFTVDGKSHRKTHYPPSPFKHETDRYLASVVSQGLGSVTPLPDLSHEKGLEKAFLESLKTEIIITESDSEKVKDLKARVITAREDMRMMLEEGMTFAEVLHDYQKRCNEDSDIRMDTARELQKIMAEGDLVGARKYITRMNLALQQMGIEEVRVPRELLTEE